MTGECIGGTLLFMVTKGKPGRRPGTPLEYQEALKLRLKGGREEAEMDIPEMAAALTKKMGRDISADTYRKWEAESMLPHDAILPACDLIKMHVFKFLGNVTDEERDVIHRFSKRKVVPLKRSPVAPVSGSRPLPNP